jgi:hypothetical protein
MRKRGGFFYLSAGKRGRGFISGRITLGFTIGLLCLGDIGTGTDYGLRVLIELPL